ncbi:MAG: FAD-dependent oxidoreductase [Alphaproteobacteria bacterium]|nr:FAD-dependent oxidoreductase [Alphaproteobacteria bacterium]
MKSHADVVVVGGGIVGCSLLYQLTRLGLSNVVLVEKTELTAGTTWHSAGHLVMLEEDPEVARINALSFNIYTNIERETGESVGLHQVGSLQLAPNRARWDRLERLLPKMQALGHGCTMIGVDEVVRHFPLIDPTGLLGASWAPSEGYIDPSMATQAFARMARAAGAEIYRQTKVTGLVRGFGKWNVETTAGPIAAEHVVLATGIWAPELTATLGIRLPIVPAERQYVVTDDVPELATLATELPILRDHDVPLYFRQERKSLIMGVHEPHTPYCFVDGIPEDFGQELLPPDLERGAACLQAGMARVPAFSRVGIKKVICGPTSRTVDFNGLMGPLWNHRNLHILAGFSAGVGQSAGVGRLMAEWIVRGEPSLDVAPLDVARFGPYATTAYVRQCLGEAHTYGSIEPGRDRAAGRPARTSPLYHRQRADGAVFVARNGWECPAWFRTETTQTAEAAVAAESSALTRGCGLADLSARSLIEVSGPESAGFLARLLGSSVPAIDGCVGLSALRLRGGGRSTGLTLYRLRNDLFHVAAEPEAQLRLLARLQLEADESGPTAIADLTGRTGCLLLLGPDATELLGRIASRGAELAAWPDGTAVAMDIGLAPARLRRIARRASESWEIQVPSEYLVGLDENLRRASGSEGLRNIGLRAVEVLSRNVRAVAAD